MDPLLASDEFPGVDPSNNPLNAQLQQIWQRRLDRKLCNAVIAGKEYDVFHWLSKGADPNLKCGNGQSMLIESCARGYYTISWMLLDHGADINYASGYNLPGHTVNCLMVCVLHDQERIACHLLTRKSLKLPRDTLHMVVTRSNCNIIKFVMNRMLCDAQQLEPTGSNLTSEPDFSAMAAFASCDTKYRRMLDFKCAQGYSPLMLATKNSVHDGGDKLWRIAELLLEAGADVRANCDRRSILIDSITMGCPLRIIRLLVRFGSDVNQPIPSGLTPLLAGCERKDPNIVAYLLSQGANPSSCSSKNLRAMRIMNELGQLRDAGDLASDRILSLLAAPKQLRLDPACKFVALTRQVVRDRIRDVLGRSVTRRMKSLLRRDMISKYLMRKLMAKSKPAQQRGQATGSSDISLGSLSAYFWYNSVLRFAVPTCHMSKRDIYAISKSISRRMRSVIRRDLKKRVLDLYMWSR